ncbi:hypothetical protein ACLOAV_009748 [Pseudogymnoascus australis]
MKIIYLIEALFVAVAIAAPAPRGGNIPAGVFPSGACPTSGIAPTGTGIAYPTGTGIHCPTGTGIHHPIGTGDGHHHHTRTSGETDPAS